MPSLKSMTSFLSQSSSVYSRNEVSEVNTTGTQIHHRSHLRHAITNEQKGQYSDISLLASASPSDSSMDIGEQRGALYRFETQQEAEDRHKHHANSTRAGTASEALRYLNEGLRIVEVQKIDDVGPRPPTPPRRRPRVTSTGSISFDRYQSDLGSLPLGMAASVMSSGFSDGTDVRKEPALLISNRETLKDLLVHGASTPSGRIADPDHGTSQVPLGSGVTVVQEVATRWHDFLEEDQDHQAQSPMVSMIGQTSRPKDYSRGYLDGDFVTNLERGAAPQKQKTQRKSKRFFCF